MKRSEMLEHIQAELEEALSNITHVSGKRYPHWIKARASNMLDMIEGFGMSPPIIDNESFKILESGEQTYEVRRWDEKK